VPGTWLLGSEVTSDGDRDGGPDGARAVLLGVRDGDAGAADPLDELERLAETDGVAVVGRLVQPRDRPDPATYLGSGKVAELADLVRDRDAGLVIADGELSPAQVRNLEDRLGARVVDRTALILDIFAQHARSSEGKAQVELAQLAYQLPWLTGHGVELSRVGGGRSAGAAAPASAAPVSSSWRPGAGTCGGG
jgi:GTPase